MLYSHPAYTAESVAAQQLLPSLNDDRVVFAGAYHGWGFHEDGALSGWRAAQRLGARWAGLLGTGAAGMLTPAIPDPDNPCPPGPGASSRFSYRGYSWYVDLDRMPRLPAGWEPFARFEVGDHFAGTPKDSLASTR